MTTRQQKMPIDLYSFFDSTSDSLCGSLPFSPEEIISVLSSKSKTPICDPKAASKQTTVNFGGRVLSAYLFRVSIQPTQEHSLPLGARVSLQSHKSRCVQHTIFFRGPSQPVLGYSASQDCFGISFKVREPTACRQNQLEHPILRVPSRHISYILMHSTARYLRLRTSTGRQIVTET